MNGDTRNITGEIGEVLRTLILDEALGKHADRLRNIDERRIRLGRDGGAVGIDADRPGARVLGIGGSRRSCGWGRPRLCGRAADRWRRVSPRHRSGNRRRLCARLDASTLRPLFGLIDRQFRQRRCRLCILAGRQQHHLAGGDESKPCEKR
jgi:hypothetical protein